MNTKTRFALILTLALLGGAALAAVAWATPGNAPLAQGGSPAVVAYQGEVRVSDAPYTGTGYFKFAVVNAAGSVTYWSNDGTSTVGDAPTAAVPLDVSDGLFSVLLGDTALGGMTQALTAGVFSQPDRYLRVWFSDDGSDFDQLTPDTRIAAVPYALQAQEAADADTVDGMHASELETHYQNVVIVAKSGGDYASVQAAIDSISDAAAANPYLVWVAPGVYSETVAMKPYVHLQGAGQEATVITSTASSSAWPPAQATLVLARDTSLRDLTVANSGTDSNQAALLAITGTARTLVADVTAQALGSGTSNSAIVLTGSDTVITLQQVTALAENGSNYNSGLVNRNGAAATLRGGSFTGKDGVYTNGIYNSGSGTTLDAMDVTALGEDSSTNNHGLFNTNGAAAVLHGGSFTARGGIYTRGIASGFNGARLEAAGVTVLAEKGSSENHGLINYSVAVATLRGGSFTGRGGENAFGIGSHDNGTTLDAESVTALAENGSGSNQGLTNSGGAAATLRGGTFTGRGGITTRGILNGGSNTTLEAESVTALGENGSSSNFGLENNGGAAVLHGGSFTARGGTSAYGIFNYQSGTTLEANSVTALGENGSILSFGLENHGGAVATLRGGNFTGREGGGASGVQNTQYSSLTAEGITALAENGSGENYGMFNNNTVTATLSGGAFTGRGGTNAYGICNELTATMKAENVTGLGENGSGDNYGLYNVNNSTAVLRGSSFTGNGGINAHGIGNFDDNTMLDAASVTALGENGSNFNFGLISGNGAPITNATANMTQSVLEGATNSVLLDSGTVTVSNSRLAGNSVSVVSGTLTCVAVSRGGTFMANGCP